MTGIWGSEVAFRFGELPSCLFCSKVVTGAMDWMNEGRELALTFKKCCCGCAGWGEEHVSVFPTRFFLVFASGSVAGYYHI